MLVWMASVPRSGNTLFRILLHTYTGLPTYSYFNDPLFTTSTVISRAMGHSRLPVENTNLCTLIDEKDLFFVKIHSKPPVLWMGCDAPAFYIVRDPRAVAVSLAHFQTWRKGRRNGVQGLIQEGWLEKWSMHVQTWLDTDTRKVIVRYEDLLTWPFQVTLQAVNALGLDIELNDKETPSFASLRTQMPKFFRCGQIDSWKTELDSETASVLWEQSGKVAMKLGYTKKGWEAAR